MSAIRYVHTNIIAADWRRLARFYCDVFGCRPVGPERDLHGDWLDKITALPGARITGIHLALPGYDRDGPTLEIFSYQPENPAAGNPAINRQGLGHTAFHVPDVAATLAALLACGGAMLGELIVRDYGDLGILTAVYARDPEGNIIEIQNWRSGCR
jgi:catechol 2,3-dioxygenase-like lactoylglutathione lyase family enzyme